LLVHTSFGFNLNVTVVQFLILDLNLLILFEYDKLNILNHSSFLYSLHLFSFIAHKCLLHLYFRNKSSHSLEHSLLFKHIASVEKQKSFEFMLDIVLIVIRNNVFVQILKNSYLYILLAWQSIFQTTSADDK